MPASTRGRRRVATGQNAKGVARCHRHKRGASKYARGAPRSSVPTPVFCNPTFLCVLGEGKPEESSRVPSRKETKQGLCTVPVRVTF